MRISGEAGFILVVCFLISMADFAKNTYKLLNSDGEFSFDGPGFGASFV